MELKDIKLKTLLIFPPLLRESDHANAYAGNRDSPPLGVAILAGYLKKRGYQNVEILNLRQYKEITLKKNKKTRLILKKIIAEKKPDIIGISVLFYPQIVWAKKIAELIKQSDKKIFIVAGGGHILHDRDSILKNPRKMGYFDGIIFGNGEEPLERLILRLAEKKKLSNISNLLLPANNKIKNTSFSALAENLDVEPCLDNLNIDEFIPIRISKGCYWGQCTFCNSCDGLKAKYQILNPRKAVRLIKKLQKKYNQNIFYFYDDAIPPYYLKKFAEELLQQKVNIAWTLYGLCFDKALVNKKLASLLKKSGLAMVCFGGESFSPRILKLMKKMHTPELAKKILETFHSFNIGVGINLMFNFPSETKKDITQTFDFLKKYQHLYKFASANIFFPKINTDVYNHSQKFNLRIKNRQKISLNFNKKDKKISNLIKRLIISKGLERKIYISSFGPFVVPSIIKDLKIILLNE